MSNSYHNAAKKLRVGKCPKTGRFKKNPIAKAILLFLADAANDDGFCFPGVEYIADVLELGESTVRKHLTYLADPKNPFIEKKKIKKNNGYQMKFAPLKPKSPLSGSTDSNDSSPLPQSGINKKSPLPSSNESQSHRYEGEFSPLPDVTATTERLNITLKGIETSDETFLKTNPQEECVTFEDFYKKAATQICASMKVFSLPNKSRWEKQMEWAFENKFTPEMFSECYRLLLKREGRIYPVTPEQVADNLPLLTDLRLQGRRKPTTNLEPSYFKSYPNASEEDCSEAERVEFLQNFQRNLDNGLVEFTHKSLEYFSENDRQWFLVNLNLEEAA